MASMSDVNFTEIISRALPLMNHTAVFMYTLCDLFKPGSADALQSALPFYQLALICIVFVMWIVVFLYFWKMVYFVVDDPYATPNGAAPPNRRNLDEFQPYKILDYIYSVF